MRTSLFSLKAILIGALGPVAVAADLVAPRYLHHIGAGTQLVARKAILIPANEADVPVGIGSGLNCVLRMREAEPYDRIIRADQALRVAGTSRASFSSSRKTSITTYIQLKSRSIQDLACQSQGMRQATYREFEQSVGTAFSIEMPSSGPLAVD